MSVETRPHCPRRSVLLEILLLLAVSTLLAIGAWRLHAPDFPLGADPEVYQLDLPHPVVAPAEALAHYREGIHLFIDARPADRFAAARVPGAMNVRPGDFDADLREIYDFIIPEDQLIVYDDGVMLNASSVAGRFEERGFEQVELLLGGFPAWRAHHGETTGDGDD